MLKRLLTKLGYVKEKRLADALKERDKWKNRCFTLVNEPNSHKALEIKFLIKIETEVERTPIYKKY